MSSKNLQCLLNDRCDMYLLYLKYLLYNVWVFLLVLITTQTSHLEFYPFSLYLRGEKRRGGEGKGGEGEREERVKDMPLRLYEAAAETLYLL